jgi:hypothetical protein
MLARGAKTAEIRGVAALARLPSMGQDGNGKSPSGMDSPDPYP